MGTSIRKVIYFSMLVLCISASAKAAETTRTTETKLPLKVSEKHQAIETGTELTAFGMPN